MAGSRKTLKKNQIFEVLSKNDPLRENFQNYILIRLIATPMDMKFREIWPTENR